MTRRLTDMYTQKREREKWETLHKDYKNQNILMKKNKKTTTLLKIIKRLEKENKCNMELSKQRN